MIRPIIQPMTTKQTIKSANVSINAEPPNIMTSIAITPTIASITASIVSKIILSYLLHKGGCEICEETKSLRFLLDSLASSNPISRNNKTRNGKHRYANKKCSVAVNRRTSGPNADKCQRNNFVLPCSFEISFHFTIHDNSPFICCFHKGSCKICEKKKEPVKRTPSPRPSQVFHSRVCGFACRIS